MPTDSDPFVPVGEYNSPLSGPIVLSRVRQGIADHLKEASEILGLSVSAYLRMVLKDHSAGVLLRDHSKRKRAAVSA